MLHVPEPQEPPQKRAEKPTFTVNSKTIHAEESKHRFEKTSEKSGSSVEVEVNHKRYKTEELVLFKHFKQTLEVLFQSFDKASISKI